MMDSTWFSSLQGDPLSDILGQEKAKRHLKSAMLVSHHAIIAGPPGIGKTTVAKNISRLLPDLELNDCEYHCDPKKPACPRCIGQKPKHKILSVSKVRLILLWKIF